MGCVPNVLGRSKKAIKKHRKAIKKAQTTVLLEARTDELLEFLGGTQVIDQPTPQPTIEKAPPIEKVPPGDRSTTEFTLI